MVSDEKEGQKGTVGEGIGQVKSQGEDVQWCRRPQVPGSTLQVDWAELGKDQWALSVVNWSDAVKCGIIVS